jgi:hypothetical protein
MFTVISITISMNKGAIVGAIVLLVIIIAGAYLILQNQANLGSNANLAVISLTDPPNVPNGTTSLMISYSAVQAHVVNASSSGWVNIQGSGSVNLLSLVNVSQIIANSGIAANSTINMVRFKVNSANITINGVTSNVSVPSSMITANVSNSGNGTSHVLVDLSPSIVSIYTNSSTVFVMVPSVRAVAFAGSRGNVQIGARAQLNSSEKAEIAARPNLSITSESVMSSGNTSTVSVTVKNNGNQSITIRHVMIHGSMQVVVKPFASVDASENANANSSEGTGINASGKSETNVNSQRRPLVMGVLNGNANANASPNASGLNTNLNGSYGIGLHNGNISVNESTIINNGKALLNETIHVVAGNVVKIGDLFINGNAITSGNVSINGSVVRIGNIISINNGEIEVDGRGTGVRISGQGAQEAANINADIKSRVSTLTTLGLEINALRSVNFAVSSNGTLILPNSERSAEGENGYVLAPGAQATFTYSGTMSAGNNHVLINFVPGSNYRVYVQGQEGADARANVTAS